MKQPFLPFRHELIVVNFAGGGGACKGIVDATGRPIDIAINHDPEAIAMHRANHPNTKHYCEDVFTVKPLEVTGGQPVGLAWFSPDCKHFSKAKGGKPVEKKIRGLAWVVLKWARLVAPRIIMLENVEEFQDWGPLDKHNKPCKVRKGRTFRSWRTQLQNCGYKMEMREIRASVLGTPTIRKRLYIILRRDGMPIVWPTPTHGPRRKPFRTAAECIDWSIPCPSIFERERPLAEATLRRIATGVFRYVINCSNPFIVPTTHSGGNSRVHPIDEPLRTVTTAQRGELALISPTITKFRKGSVGHRLDEPLHTITAGGDMKRPAGAAHALGIVVPTLIQTSYGERPGQHPRVPGLEKPLGTVVADGQKHALVAAFLEQANTGMVGHDARKPLSTIVGKGCTQRIVAAHIERQMGKSIGHAADVPLGTVTAGGGGKSALVTSHLLKLKGTSKAGQRITEPLHTVQAGGTHYGEVRAFLIKYYSSGDGKTGASLRKPMPTLPTKDRIGLVTVAGAEYAIVDIGMRMLQPRELYRAQGFPDSYVIDPVVNGKPLTKTAQVRMCGNSVCPPVAEALVRANFRHERKYEAVAA